MHIWDECILASFGKTARCEVNRSQTDLWASDTVTEQNPQNRLENPSRNPEQRQCGLSKGTHQTGNRTISVFERLVCEYVCVGVSFSVLYIHFLWCGMAEVIEVKSVLCCGHSCFIEVNRDSTFLARIPHFIDYSKILSVLNQRFNAINCYKPILENFNSFCASTRNGFHCKNTLNKQK